MNVGLEFSLGSTTETEFFFQDCHRLRSIKQNHIIGFCICKTKKLAKRIETAYLSVITCISFSFLVASVS